MAGNWDNSAAGASFVARAGTVTFDGATGTLQQLISGGTTTGKGFSNFYFVGASTLQPTGTNLYVSSNFTLSSAANFFDASCDRRAGPARLGAVQGPGATHVRRGSSIEARATPWSRS